MPQTLAPANDHRFLDPLPFGQQTAGNGIAPKLLRGAMTLPRHVGPVRIEPVILPRGLIAFRNGGQGIALRIIDMLGHDALFPDHGRRAVFLIGHDTGWNASHDALRGGTALRRDDLTL